MFICPFSGLRKLLKCVNVKILTLCEIALQDVTFNKWANFLINLVRYSNFLLFLTS